MSEVEALKKWCAAQDDSPRMHINGSDFPTALVSVDFGQPLKGVHLSADRGNELSTLLKAAGKELYRKKSSLRVNFDNQRGVFWVSAL